MSETVQNFMNQYDISEMRWGAYKICVNNITYNNYEDIPLEVYKTIQNILNIIVLLIWIQKNI